MTDIVQQEQWKDIPGFEGRYQVSDLGNVKSLKFYSKCPYSKILKPRQGKYLRVNLGANGDRYIHRLVALLFVPNDNPSILVEVDHYDFNKHNNKATNLKWCTHSYNMKRAHENGRVVFSEDARNRISIAVKESWRLKKIKNG
jgi:hypothetical protein